MLNLLYDYDTIYNLVLLCVGCGFGIQRLLHQELLHHRISLVT